MTTTVRPATQGDLPHVASHYGKGDSPWDPFGDVAKLEEIPRGGLLIAEVSGEYTGFLYWFEGQKPWFDVDVSRFAQIEEVQVLPKFRGQGVGKRLLTSALDRLGNAAVDAIYVETTEENSVARRLYEGAGFQPLFRTVLYKRHR